MVLSHGSAVVLVTSVRGYSLTPVLQAAQTPLWLCDILRSPGVVGCVFYRVLFYLYRLPHIARWAKAGILHPAPPPRHHTLGGRNGGSGRWRWFRTQAGTRCVSSTPRGPAVLVPKEGFAQSAGRGQRRDQEGPEPAGGGRRRGDGEAEGSRGPRRVCGTGSESSPPRPKPALACRCRREVSRSGSVPLSPSIH